MLRRSVALVFVGSLAVATSCGTDGANEPVEPTIATTNTTTNTTTSTAVPTTVTSIVATTLPRVAVETIGTSVDGRPIEARHRLDLPGANLDRDAGRVTVLVVGVIHGDESAGSRIVDVLRDLPVSAFADPVRSRIDLWLVPTINPDGLADGRRTNANLVDLNRNFPFDWGPIEEPGHWEYAGTGPASEPETRAFMDFVTRLRPDLTVWYHQDAYSIAPSKGPDGPVRVEYARRTGLPLEGVPGGRYTGVAAVWQRETFPDRTAFIVELGATLSDADAVMHAEAVLDVTAFLPPR